MSIGFFLITLFFSVLTAAIASLGALDALAAALSSSTGTNPTSLTMALLGSALQWFVSRSAILTSLTQALLPPVAMATVTRAVPTIFCGIFAEVHMFSIYITFAVFNILLCCLYFSHVAVRRCGVSIGCALQRVFSTSRFSTMQCISRLFAGGFHVNGPNHRHTNTLSTRRTTRSRSAPRCILGFMFKLNKCSYQIRQ